MIDIATAPTEIDLAVNIGATIQADRSPRRLALGTEKDAQRQRRHEAEGGGLSA